MNAPEIPVVAKPAKDGGTAFGSIIPFWGEFLVSPSPLEWSLNYCSHGCAYCFANLNAPTRKGEAIKALRQVADIGKRKTLTDLLLRSGYPVCISNKTDPFAESNHRETVPVMVAMKEQGVGMQFQTKGGNNRALDAVLDGLPPSVWYLTVSQFDDALRARIEPGAPPIPERLDLIDRLIAEGHYVVVGVNPAVPEWLPDPEPLMRDLADRGVWGVWVERMHLSHKQLSFMGSPSKRAIGESVIDRAMALRSNVTDMEQVFLLQCGQAAVGYGMEWFTYTHPHATDFFEPWKVCYRKTMPVVQDAINYCYDEGYDESRLISFEEYVAMLEGASGDFPRGDPDSNMGKLHIGDYMRVCSFMTVEKYGKSWTDKMTYRQMMYMAWKHPSTKLSPACSANFAMATIVNDDGDDEILTDTQGKPYYVFSPRGIDGYYFNFTGEAADPEQVQDRNPDAG